jgi:hypothetical protein
VIHVVLGVAAGCSRRAVAYTPQNCRIRSGRTRAVTPTEPVARPQARLVAAPTASASHGKPHSGDPAFKPAPDGFRWRIATGATTRRNGAWHQLGDDIRTDKPQQASLQMALQRIGACNRPGASAVMRGGVRWARPEQTDFRQVGSGHPRPSH